jgi:membrane-bound metal-dependent hydrolase YbcI (DUF457 family)
MIFFGHIGITLLFGFLVFGALKEKIDYRFLVIGALLPDMIDKPVGHYIFFEAFQNGRIFSHTLAFVALLTLVAYYAEKRYRFTGMGVLALGALMHIAEDQMWNMRETLFWPAFGLEFPRMDLSNYSGYLLYVLTHEPDAYIPEIAGLLIIAGFVYKFRLYQPERVFFYMRQSWIPAREERATS